MAVRGIADVHVGNHRWPQGQPVVAGLNARCEEALTVLRQAAQLCAPDDVLVVAGDLVDTVEGTDARMIAAVRDALSCHPGGLEQVIVVAGNHDQASTDEGDHALGALAPAEVVTQPCVIRGVACAPYVPGRSMVDVARDALESGPAHVLAIHSGVEDDRTAPWLVGGGIPVADLADLCAAHGVMCVIAGDWHDHRRWEVDTDHGVVQLVQCGALVPTGWDNLGLDGYGTVVTWYPEDSRLEVTHIPGPRFVNVKAVSAARDMIERGKAAGHRVRARVKADPTQLASVAESVSDDTDIDVRPDDEAVAATVTAAAEAATSLVSSVDEAAVAFATERYGERAAAKVADHIRTVRSYAG